ncbi:MAG TPA: hypothetical protein IAB70_02185 [Candidatus Merdicola faecigallinarum]|uniref:Uncharacterized protein n=1 Tax=Candidatus Merdicola faecigallinarum TaxID=2840862 RepID=A0A9D1S8R2_9FIRM|nr:hypothetical protein [Candidatus Merdicola faecigallinarum]
MKEKKIIDLWRSGLSKNKIAEIYRREYNMQIKIIRSSVRHRHSGRFITNYEALSIVERTVYRYLKGENK